jgi:hypothetical protein
MVRSAPRRILAETLQFAIVFERCKIYFALAENPCGGDAPSYTKRSAFRRRIAITIQELHFVNITAGHGSKRAVQSVNLVPSIVVCSGGHMKALCVLAIGLVLSASAAYATPDGSDPSVIINKTMNSGSGPGDPTFETNSAENPLVITLSGGEAGAITFDFEPAEGDPQTLSELFVQLDNALPLEQFFCESDIFTGECGSFSTGVDNAVGLIFTGGTLSAGDEFYVQVPEPRSWILLGLSMLALLMLGMRYWEPGRSEQ